MRTLYLLPLVLAAACDDGGYADPDDHDGDAVQRIQNDSDARLILTQDGDFHKGTRGKWFVDCGDESVDVLKVTDQDGELVIVGTDDTLASECAVEIDGREVKEITISGNGDLRIEDYVKNLVYLEVTGNGTADLDTVETPHLDLVLTGNGEVIARDLHTRDLTIDLHGNTEVTLGGDVDDAMITSTANGAIVARELDIQDLVLDLGGASDSQVTVRHLISGEVRDSAFLEVFGNPEGEVSEFGNADVEWH